MKTFQEFINESTEYIFSGESDFMEKNKRLFSKVKIKSVEVDDDEGITEFTVVGDDDEIEALGDQLERVSKTGAFGGFMEK